MTLTRSRFASILTALALLFAASAGARAEGTSQTVNVAERIQKMADITTRATGAISERQTAVISKLNELHTAGATNPRVLGAARKGLGAIHEAAARGRREIAKIAEVTIRQLIRQKADQAQIDQVKAARDADFAAIKTAADAARDAVKATLQGFGITPPADAAN